MAKKRWDQVGLISIVIFVVLSSIFLFQKSSLSVDQIRDSGKWIEEISTNKSRYLPSEKVEVDILLKNPQEEKLNGKIKYLIKQYHQVIDEGELDVLLNEKEEKRTNFIWQANQTDFQGYSVEVCLLKGKKILDFKTTAIDVSSDWSKFPRYGYITYYPKMTRDEIAEKINFLNRFHINGLQFYDWQYKHHQPLAGTIDEPKNQWKEIANRDVYFDTVKGYIEEAHQKNMMAMNYNLMFGAYQYSEEDGVKKEWGLFKDWDHSFQDGHPLPNQWATSKLLLFNPSNLEWQQYINKEEKKVFQVFKFDGWHVDQLGDRGRLYDYDGNIVSLDQTYAPFLINAKKELNTRLVFNAVSQYGQIQVAQQAPVDFLYTEVWPNAFGSYGHLKSIIDSNLKFSKGKKNTVLAAYMNYKLADQKGEFNTSGVLLTDSVIFASGGAHLELGDTGMLAKEYFPNKNLAMKLDLIASLEDYYHFLVAYQNLLRDEVTEKEAVVNSDQVELSDFADSGKVWYFVKEKPGYEILHFINLTNQSSVQWRDDAGDYPVPETIKDFTIRYYTDAELSGVYFASPNLNKGIASELSFKSGSDEQGKYVVFKVPFLQYWDMIYFTKK